MAMSRRKGKYEIFIEHDTFFLLSVCLSSATVVVVRFVGTAAGVTDQEQLEGGNGFFFLFSYSRGRRRWI
jgi:hypothetical protein